MTTDTSEKGLEETIESVLLNSGYEKRTSKDFNTDYAIDEGMLRTFLESTQRDKVQRARIYDSEVNTRKFYERLRGQITQRGIVDVLRQGVEHNATKFILYFPTPLDANLQAKALYDNTLLAKNIKKQPTKWAENILAGIEASKTPEMARKVTLLHI